MMVGTQGRGRGKKSVEQHKLEGTFRADRHAPAIPTPTGKPVKPDWLKGKFASEYWDLITPRLEELGIATDLDSESLAAHCLWYGEFREAVEQPVNYDAGLLAVAQAMEHLADVAEAVKDDTLNHVAQLACDLIVKEIDKRMPKMNDILSRKKLTFEQYSKSCARFGLTPMDRRAMPDIATNDDPNDPLTEYLKQRQQGFDN